MKKLIILIVGMFVSVNASAYWECISTCRVSVNSEKVLSAVGRTMFEAYNNLYNKCKASGHTYQLTTTPVCASEN